MIAAVRMGWYKLYYPVEYYAAWFTVHHEEFDWETVINGKDAVGQALASLHSKATKYWDDAARKRERTNTYMVTYEAMARGIVFLPPDPELSHQEQFLPENGKIRLSSSPSGR